MSSIGHLAAACAGVIAATVLAPPGAWAATPLAALRFASDVSVVLGGTLVEPSGVFEDDFAGNVVPLDLGNLPADAHVDAYRLMLGGNEILSFDTTVSLPGGVTAGPADVVRFDGAAYTIAFAAADNDVPEGVNVDAVDAAPGSLFLSFDTTVRLDAETYDDEDVVEFTVATGAFAPSFDGSAAGIPAELDVDGLQRIGPQRLLITFDGSGSIDGVDFDDDDVLEYDADAAVWELAYFGSSNHPGWEPGDLVAPHGIVAGPTVTPTGTVTPTDTSGPSPTPTATPGATESEAPASPTATQPPVSVTPTATSDGATPTPTVTGETTPTPTLTPTRTGSPGACTGDCDGSGQVTIDELITIVQIALGQGLVADCIDADANDDGAIGIDEIVAAVGRALDGC